VDEQMKSIAQPGNPADVVPPPLILALAISNGNDQQRNVSEEFVSS